MKATTHSAFFTSLIVFLVLGLMVNPIFANDLSTGQNRGISTNSFTENTFTQNTSNELDSFQLPVENTQELNGSSAGTGTLNDNGRLNPLSIRTMPTDNVDLTIDINMSTGSNGGANTTSSATTDSADFAIANLDVTKASFAHASSTPAFVVPTNNNTSDTSDVSVIVDGTSISPVDTASSSVAGSNLVVADINDDGATDVLGDCDEIDCIAYVNDGTGRLIEDGVATVLEGVDVDTDTVVVAEPVDNKQIAFFLKMIQLTDMNGDGHRDVVEPTNNGFLIRYYIGNNTFTAEDEYPYEDSDNEDPEEECDPFELGDGDCVQ